MIESLKKLLIKKTCERKGEAKKKKNGPKIWQEKTQ